MNKSFVCGAIYLVVQRKLCICIPNMQMGCDVDGSSMRKLCEFDFFFLSSYFDDAQPYSKEKIKNLIHAFFFFSLFIYSSCDWMHLHLHMMISDHHQYEMAIWEESKKIEDEKKIHTMMWVTDTKGYRLAKEEEKKKKGLK